MILIFAALRNSKLRYFLFSSQQLSNLKIKDGNYAGK